MKTSDNMPFILWSLATVILTVICFIFLPSLLITEKIYYEDHPKSIPFDKGTKQTVIYRSSDKWPGNYVNGQPNRKV
jgi:hypothetical protein